MSSHGNNQLAGETPVLQMDPATFLAAVTVAVTAIMAQLNANNPNGNGNGVGNSNRSNNQGNQWGTTCQDTPNSKLKGMKRKLGNKKGSSSTQGPTKRQQPVAVHTPTCPLPQHWGDHIMGTSRSAASAATIIRVCREFHCKRCNKKGQCDNPKFIPSL